jgi:tRNA 5-methylaminomethyl-2-thiouridine biosynthesis bifunctional protein
MKKILIIGGGLAGTSLAYVLQQAGLTPVLVEAGETLAPGASGNQIGLYNPRFAAEWSPPSQFYSAAYFKALEAFAALEGINWDACGTLHLITDEKKARRFAKTLKSWDWSAEDMQLLSKAEASKVAGVEITHEALYLPRGGSVCPEKLCQAYAKGVEVHLNMKVESLLQAKEAYAADAVVVANGLGALGFEECQGLPLRPVRGQVTLVKAKAETKALRCNLCYVGYMSRELERMHVIGSSFQPWLDHSEIIAQDDQDNIEKLHAAIPAWRDISFEMIGNRAAVRTTSKDYFPVVGTLAESMHISTAHGSHGVVSTLMAAHILCGEISGRPAALSDDVLKALSPKRFPA